MSIDQANRIGCSAEPLQNNYQFSDAFIGYAIRNVKCETSVFLRAWKGGISLDFISQFRH